MKTNFPTIKILHLEDNPNDAEDVALVLKKAKIPNEILVVDSRTAYIQALTEFCPEIIIARSLSSFNVIKAYDMMRRLSIKIPMIVITSPVSEAFAIESVKYGIYNYVLKDRLLRLPMTLLNAIEKHRLEVELRDSEERYFNLMQNISANVVLLDNVGTILKVNNSWKSFINDNDIKLRNYGIGSHALDVAKRICDNEEDYNNILTSASEILEGKANNFSFLYSIYLNNVKRSFRLIIARENNNKNSGIMVIQERTLALETMEPSSLEEASTLVKIS